jgi:hypothetical protein
MKFTRPSHATLIAYLALFVALGGTVYAASRINGKQIRPRSTPGNRLKRNGVTGKQVKESSLNALNFIQPNAKIRGSCAGPSAGTDRCASTTLRLRHPSRVVAIVSGGSAAVSAPSGGGVNQLFCGVDLDGKAGAFIGAPPTYGETAIANSSSLATNGFAFATLSHGKVKAGKHEVQFVCNSETDQVQSPTIVAFAISGG